ncbi:MAG: transketolase, partial [Planctomycetes bacterium]|nr:transketolase [Planctomycetota bacterium]
MTSETEIPPRTGRWAELAARLRADAIRCTTAAGSGHPTSALSAADLMAVLLDGHLRRHVHREDPANDHLVFSKGHACPLLYAMLRRVGAISDQELLSLRSAGSRIEGHPTPLVPWVEAATGSLGQGLPFAVGLAIGARLDGVDAMSWVLLGDSEMAEGSNWEAFDKAAHYGL